ncbi:hypothetical protein V6N13_118558 [Hibiscus sabdariffa]
MTTIEETPPLKEWAERQKWDAPSALCDWWPELGTLSLVKRRGTTSQYPIISLILCSLSKLKNSSPPNCITVIA